METLSIDACLEAGYSTEQIDEYLGLRQGTIRDRKYGTSSNHLRTASWFEIRDEIVACEDTSEQIQILFDVPEYRMKRMRHSVRSLYPMPNFHKPEWIRALIKLNVNLHSCPYWTTPVIWELVCPESMRILIADGANVNHSISGQSLMERYAISDKPWKVECMTILIEAGADVRPLFKSLYERTTFLDSVSIIHALLEAGHDVDLKRTLLYRLYRDKHIPYNYLYRYFRYDPYGPSQHTKYPDYESMLEAAKAIHNGQLEKVEDVIDQVVVKKRKTIETQLTPDVSFLVAHALCQNVKY